MGCGCGGQPARRAIRSVRPTPGVVKAAMNNNAVLTQEQKEAEDHADERKKIEKLRRDAILRALGRP